MDRFEHTNTNGSRARVRVPMRQSITTRYHGPTNHRGSRVSARCQAKKVTIPWDHALDSGENHANAAHVLVAQLGWAGEWKGGALPDGTGYAFVHTGDAS